MRKEEEVKEEVETHGGGEKAIANSLKRLKLGDPTECQDYVRIKVQRAPVVGQEEPGEEEVKQKKRRGVDDMGVDELSGEI